MVTLDLSKEDSCLLLAGVVELWVTIRGFSIASRLVEEHKEALQITTQDQKLFEVVPVHLCKESYTSFKQIITQNHLWACD